MLCRCGITESTIEVEYLKDIKLESLVYACACPRLLLIGMLYAGTTCMVPPNRVEVCVIGGKSTP